MVGVLLLATKFTDLPLRTGVPLARSAVAGILLIILAMTAGCGDTGDTGETDKATPSQSTDTSTADSARDDTGTGGSADSTDSSVAPHSTTTSEASDKQSSDTTKVLFEPVANELGVSHVYDTGAKGQLLMVESTGAGLGWIDLDLDGALDLYLVQGGDPTLRDLSANLSDQVFRGQNGKMKAVTVLTGIDDRAYSQGVAVGDFDNDGFPDLYVTNVGQNTLFRNCGDGTFRKVSSAGVTASRVWSSSAAWGDIDLDGDLDLYVCNYLRYDPYDPFPCEKDGKPAMCHPFQIEHWPDEFYENLGNGMFRECAKAKGLFGDGNKALGVIVSDLSGDGWPDIYVANDTTANFYFINQKNGVFSESSSQLGGALNASGAMQASMGIAAGDYDRSGTTDLLLTHFTGESNTLYQNLSDLGLFDVTGRTGLLPITDPKLGFGTVMADFDANGQMELMIANGHIDSSNADGDGFMQHAQLLSFDGQRWKDIGAEPSEYFARKHVGRGVALGDFDGDGDPDLAVGHQNESAEILRNTSDGGHWLKVVPIARDSNRSALHVSGVVEVDGEKWYSGLHGGTSFCSSHEKALFFGLGEEESAATIRLTWPNGRESVLENVALNQILTIQEPR